MATADPAASAPSADPLGRIRPRGIVLGLALVIGLAFVMPWVNLALRKYDWAFRPLSTGPVFVLFLLIWPLNTLLHRVRPSWAFTRQEFLLGYAMMAISAGLIYEGLWGYALYHSVYPFYAASAANRWAELILPNLPVWLTVSDPELVTGFFHGAAPGQGWAWRPWLSPVLAWSCLALSVYLFLYCLGALVRKEWIESERLAFPLAAIPLEMASQERPTLHGPVWRCPYLWVGASLPLLQNLLQMAHAYAPAVPYSRLYYPLGHWFTGRGPWETLSDTAAYIGFDTIGIFGLLPVEVSLSLWFFFLLNRLEILVFSILGYGHGGVAARAFSPGAFISYQEVGACLMLAGILLWRSRGYLTTAARALLGQRSRPDPLAPMSPPAALLGLIASGLALALWGRAAGLDPFAFAALLAVFFGYSLTMARLVSAGGVYVPDMSVTPRSFLVALRGAAAYPARTLTMFSMLQSPFTRQYKLNLLHFALNNFKIAHSAGLPGRLTTACLWASLLIIMAIVPWVTLRYAYSLGAFTFDSWLFRDMGAWEFGELASDLRSPQPAIPFLPAGLAFGAAIMAGLMWLHGRFIWFAISPLGFIMAGTWGMVQRMWANAFIAWLLVTIIRRAGGLRLYRTVRPAFLGMVISHLVIMGLRSLLDPLIGLHMHLAAWE